ncbi:hypothetical protein [Membranihabitans marinus]|uniref:hypothetical protein n=1 Tax=Membranihabitans marinus TaxID=1227546 RepID=UPI001F23AD99|nr:hypothetical protein [Membranihabitans marinus]
MKIALLYISASLLIIPTIISCHSETKKHHRQFDQALANGQLANEGYRRCVDFTKDWLTVADPVSGLIPENLTKGTDIWNGHNSAADNYPFMVLTAMIADRPMLESTMTNMLRFEEKNTTRLGSLTDDYSFSKQGFARESIDTAKIIFSSSEYVKDGLVPLTEFAGHTAWSERMFDILDDLHKLARYNGRFNPDFFSQSKETEVYGELLQALTRAYWMTQNQKYLDWAIEIGDYYLIENPNRLLKAESLRLRDHGCEIIGGLSELYATVHFVDTDKKEAYRKALYPIMDRVLEVGRNPDGMFFNEVNMVTGDIVEEGIVDNWGYTYNAYYTLYLIDQHQLYRDAVLHPLPILKDKYHNYNWERYGADGFADAIEGGINLYNREPVEELMEWIDNEVQVFWSIQDSAFRPECAEWKNRGIIEGWHGDGNFARTIIMYCLMKTNDITIQPWQNDVIYGSVLSNDSLFITLTTEQQWQGQLMFSNSRQQHIMKMPLDYPRINQFAQWYAVDPEANYEWYNVDTDHKEILTGASLINGIDMDIDQGEIYNIIVTKQNM